MYYRFKTALIFSFPIDFTLDKALKECIESGLKSINSTSPHHTTAKFNNGTKFTYWNSNKYHAWLSEGVFEFSNGNKYAYKDVRPKAKTMYSMIVLLKKFNYCI